MSRAPRSRSAKRDWGSDDSQTPILHVDMDAFFVSVELLDRPHLRGVPLAVGGQERGVISAASYEARAYGVNSAMPVAQAKRLCPQLVILPVNTARYHEVSERIMAFLRTLSPLVEQLSIDEAFLDVSSVRKLFGSPVKIAQRIRAQIRQQEGVPASVGIAQSKHLAKIASAHAKPDGMLLIPASASLDFLHSLPVGALWGVGDKTRALLERKGVCTVADVAALGERALVAMLGEAAGARLYALSINKDERAVIPERIEKSMSKEQTFFDLLMSVRQVEKVVLSQSYEVGRRLRDEGMLAGAISIKVRSASFSTISRSVTLAVPTDSSSAIYSAARRLLRSIDFPSDGVRLIGVKASQLVSAREGVQLALDDDGKSGHIDQALDAVYRRYGKGALSLGSLVHEEERSSQSCSSAQTDTDTRIRYPRDKAKEE